MAAPASLSDFEAKLAQKQVLRERALKERDAIPAAEREAAAEAIAASPLPIAITPGVVASGFMPIRTEISPLPLMRRLAKAGAQLALPTIQGRGKPLIMRTWNFGEPLIRGQWGIREPSPAADEVFPEIALVPLAAFDRRGYRIGYGAGYYDRTLAALRSSKALTAIGIAYAQQECPEVPALPHDQPLDFVLTERQLIDCGRH